MRSTRCLPAAATAGERVLPRQHATSLPKRPRNKKPDFGIVFGASIVETAEGPKVLLLFNETCR
jgi:hypothetical protein